MKKKKIVLGLCGFCLFLSSCGSSPNTTVDNSTDLNNHSISTTSMSRETSDIRYLKKELEDGTLSIWYFDTSTPQDTIAIPEEINGKTVSQIGERLFEGNEEVRKQFERSATVHLILQHHWKKLKFQVQWRY